MKEPLYNPEYLPLYKAAGILLLLIVLETWLVLRIRRKVRARATPLRGDLVWTFGDLGWVTLASLPFLGLFLGLLLQEFRVRMDVPEGLDTVLKEFGTLRFVLAGNAAMLLASAAAFLGLGRVRHRLAWSEMGIWFPGLKEALLRPLAWTVGFLALAWFYEQALAWGGTRLESQVLAQLIPTARSGAEQAFLLGTAGLLLPALEELLFRGFLFPLFSRYFGIFWGMALSSFLFARGHVEPVPGMDGAVQNLLRLPLLFLLGLLLCRLFHRSGSLAGPFVAHASNNLIDLARLLDL